MNKKIIKKDLDKLISEESISGEKITKRAQNISKKENNSYYKDVESKMSDYDKNLKQTDKDDVDPKKFNVEDEEKEYHEDMEIMNGQEMIQYDREPNKEFADRARKAIEGDSTMGNKTYTGDENGNTEPVWGASDAEFGKKLVDRANKSKKKRDDSIQTWNKFGSDFENSDEEPKAKSRKIATAKNEGMKRIKFKKPFNGVGNALKLIPEGFKVDNKKFELTDGDESYKIRWKGSLTEGNAIILEATSKDFINESYNKIKHLMNYKSENYLGSIDGKGRVSENEIMKNKLNQDRINEDTSQEVELIKKK